MPDKPSSVSRLSRRNAVLMQKYPLLKLVPEEKRQKIFRKAVLHPVILLVLIVLGGFILPFMLNYLIILLDIPTEASDSLSLLKIMILLAVPFLAIMVLLKKILLPFCLRRVLVKEGYLSDNQQQ